MSLRYLQIHRLCCLCLMYLTSEQIGSGIISRGRVMLPVNTYGRGYVFRTWARPKTYVVVGQY